MKERIARMALTCVSEPATPALARAVADFGAQSVWEMLLSGEDGLSKKAANLDLESVQRLAKQSQVRFLIPDDDEWPARLADLYDCDEVNAMTGMPIGLWVRGSGNLAQLCQKSVAMVGARAATAYGETVANDMAVTLGDAGFSVISGGAYGIDAAAHRGALVSRTPTVAVSAGGVNVSYPPSHERLFSKICEKGVVISEIPPGCHPTRVRFLGRNRLIAALAPGTVMVEAGVRSGAKNTLNWANTMNRVTMAVPGAVTSAMSYGCHELIREAQAVLVSDASQVRELLEPVGNGSVKRPISKKRPTDDLSPMELRVFETLPAHGSRSAEELALACELSLAQTLGVLSQLADAEFVTQTDSLAWKLAKKPVR